MVGIVKKGGCCFIFVVFVTMDCKTVCRRGAPIDDNFGYIVSLSFRLIVTDAFLGLNGCQTVALEPSTTLAGVTAKKPNAAREFRESSIDSNWFA